MGKRRHEDPREKPVTRLFASELKKTIGERKGRRVATMYPIAYRPHHLYSNVIVGEKDRHRFIKFTDALAEARKIPFTGRYRDDAKRAEEQTGRTAKDTEVWHHVADLDSKRRGTMQLVPKALHAAIPHWGGSAISRRQRLAAPGVSLNGRRLMTSR